MKKQIILWLSAIIITYVIIYMGHLTSIYYPLTGTEGIEGKRVTFMFPRVYRGAGDYQVKVFKEISGANAFLLWRRDYDAQLKRVPMKDSGNFFVSSIPFQKPHTHIIYRIEIEKNGKIYLFPYNRSAQMVMLGKVPPTIMNLFYFFLYGGIFLFVRAGLEYFHENKRVKLYTIFGAIFFFCYTIAVTPLKASYEFGAIGKWVPGPIDLWNLQSLLLLLTAILSLPLIIGSKKPKWRGIVIAVVILLIYLLFPIKY
jgi:hypothetical protein